MTPVRVLVADDHDFVRRGIRDLLEGQPGWVVCGEARTGREAVAMAIELRPDIVIVDFSMPELNGLEAIRQIRVAVPARILALTMHSSDQVVTAMVDAGADGYILKTDAGQTLVDAVQALVERREFFTPGVQTAVAAARSGRVGQVNLFGHERRIVPGPLTSREREVLQLLAEGKSNKEVGVMLGISTKTAETHRARILAKLDLHSAAEMVRYAIRNRIIEA